MDMRVTFQTMVNDALVNTQLQTDQITKLQEQAATGKRILQPSDDPMAMRLVMAGQAEQDRLDTYLGNICNTHTRLNTSVASLHQADGFMSQAKSIAIQAANSVNDSTSLESLAQQVDQLITQMLGVANTKQNDHHIYGGTATNTAPFAVTASDSLGRPTVIAYQGNDQSTQVAVGLNQSVTTYSPGNQVFPGAFQALIALRDDLRNTAGASQTQQIHAISQQISSLDQADQPILQTTGQQSAELKTLGDLQNTTQDMKLTTQKFISALQDADMAQVAVNLQAMENQFQLTLATIARMFNQSLLDYLH
jgi:flagellar hook-associated protein 3 FlgL